MGLPFTTTCGIDHRIHAYFRAVHYDYDIHISIMFTLLFHFCLYLKLRFFWKVCSGIHRRICFCLVWRLPITRYIVTGILTWAFVVRGTENSDYLS